MAKKLSDYFSTLPASGGFQNPSPVPGLLESLRPTQPVMPQFGSPSPVPGLLSSMAAPKPNMTMVATGKPGVGTIQRSTMTPLSAAGRSTPAPAPAPAVPGVGAPSGPLFGSSTAGPNRDPLGMGGATGAAPAGQNPIDPKYMKADGSYKTADEIAAEIAAGLRTAQEGAGDIGTLSAQQFGGGPATTVEAEAEARRIGNIRNDIAVGEADPYKVGADSGIAYTAAELKAIENAYAGIYDPALDTALAKVEQKRSEDEMRLSAQLAAEAEANAPYTLGKDQVRIGKDGKVIASGMTDSGFDGSTYVAGSNPTADAYVAGIKNKSIKMSDVPAEYKGLVAQGMAAVGDTGSQYNRDQARTALTEIDNALGYLDGSKSGLINSAGSPVGRALTGFLPGSDTVNLNVALDTVKAIVGFDALQRMREESPTGGALGQITERELSFLQSVQGSLNTMQSTEKLVETLQRVQKSFEIIEIINSPDGTAFEMDGSRYIKVGEEMIPEEDFNSVGNTSASTGNRPQRNNNPGNVKAGGIADALAVGTDEQGHLIFPTAEAGMKALRAELTAKINGGSRWLPPNPTIAQLGSVYAEDGSWGKKVSTILGVPPTTRTQDVPFDRLMEAVKQQEGWYA